MSEWSVPFVIVRPSSDGTTQVFQCDDLKKAKYWIKYIAEAGDVLCRTPLSNVHSKESTQIEYWCHKESSGKVVTNKEQWQKFLTENFPSVKLPEKQEQISEV